MTNPAASLRAISGYVRMRQQQRNLLSRVQECTPSFTMISQPDYLLNLQLAETVAERGRRGSGMRRLAGRNDCGSYPAPGYFGPSREYVLCDSFQGLPQAQVDRRPDRRSYGSATRIVRRLLRQLHREGSRKPARRWHCHRHAECRSSPGGSKRRCPRCASTEVSPCSASMRTGTNQRRMCLDSPLRPRRSQVD